MVSMRIHRRITALALTLLLGACGRSAPEATAPAAPAAAPAAKAPAIVIGPRVVSTVPAATLNLVLMGAADNLVGVSKYDKIYLPPDKQDLPVVGDYQDLNYEQLVKLKPNVLVMQQDETRIEPRLKRFVADQHIELINMHFENVADIWKSVAALGKAVDRERDAARAIEKAQRDLAEVTAKYQHAPHPKVLYLVSPKLMLISGGHTFIDEMITAAGAVNVGAKAGNGFIETSRETIVKLAPEVLMIGALDETEEIVNDPRLTTWADLPVPAARSKRIFLVTDGNSLMASVDIGKNVRSLAELIHRGETPDASAADPAGGSPESKMIPPATLSRVPAAPRSDAPPAEPGADRRDVPPSADRGGNP